MDDFAKLMLSVLLHVMGCLICA